MQLIYSLHILDIFCIAELAGKNYCDFNQPIFFAETVCLGASPTALRSFVRVPNFFFHSYI